MIEETREEKIARKYVLIRSAANLLRYGYSIPNAVNTILSLEKVVEEEING